MVIDQRKAGASTSVTSSDYFSCDRWQQWTSQSGKYTVQRSSTAPTGFVNSMLATSSSAYAVLTGDYFAFSQQIEGNNVADLAWGTASAATVTLSFWVRSSLTGTFGGAVSNSAVTRSYPFSYTITSANTYEQKTITIAGDTSGTWLTDTGIGFRVWFGFGVGATYSGTAGSWAGADYRSATGATSVVGTNGATFYITGVQLEKGSTATSFDYRPFGTELMLCQRYYCKTFNTSTAPAQNTGSYDGSFMAVSINAAANTGLVINWQFPSEMRAAPSITTYCPFAANANWYSPAGPTTSTTVSVYPISTRCTTIYNANAPAIGADANYYIQASAAAEL